MAEGRGRRVLLGLCMSGYGFFYAGFLFHRSVHLEVGRYSRTFVAFLALMALPFLLPWVVPPLRRKLGARRFRFLLFTLSGPLVAAYGIACLWDYHTQRHPFDPFLQAPPARELRNTPAYAEPGTIRILALGGSTTRRGYARALGPVLKERFPDRKFEILNAGMDWYTTKHSLIAYTTQYRGLHPHLVLVMHAINDLYRSFENPDFTLGPYDPQWTNYYAASIEGANPRTITDRLLNVFHPKIWYPNLRMRPVDYPLSRYYSLQSFEPFMRGLAHYVKADGVKVALLSQPTLLTETMGREERKRLFFSTELCYTRRSVLTAEYPTPESLSRALRAFNNTTRAVAAAEGVPFIDVEARVPKTLEYFTDEVHYTKLGERTAGEAVADALAGMDLGIER